MLITFPAFYREFSCIAGKCPDTCCAGWQIMIDNKSLKKYRRFKGSFRNRLHNDIDWQEHSFRQYHHRCAFLNDENLCDIYSEASAHMLCDTCRKYPRHIEEYEGLREYSLSLSCPEAARILLMQKDPISFVTKEISAPDETYKNFDYLLFTALMDARDYLLSVVQDRQIPVKIRLWKLFVCAHDLQLCVDRNELYKWEDLCKRHQTSGCGLNFQEKFQKWTFSDPFFLPPLQTKKHLWKSIIPQMEVLRSGWHDYLRQTLTPLFTYTDEDFTKLCAEFENACPEWTIQKEHLLVYWIYSYFCGAVYDGCIFAKIKMALVCTSMIQDLAVGTYLCNDRKFTTDDLIRICYRFSREFEHSDLNLNKLEEMMEEVH